MQILYLLLHILRVRCFYHIVGSIDKMGILKNPLHKRIGILGMAGVNNGPFYG